MKIIFKLISFTLVLLLVLTALPLNIANASESGEILRDRGILKGDLDGDLLLDQPLKRQDVVVLLSRLLGEEETAENYPGKPTFTDIKDPYYIPFIAWAEDSGLTEGIGNDLFGYDDYLTNQQLMAFLLRALGYEYYGADYGLVPGKALELDLSPTGEQWSEITTRQIMADRTVTLLRRGRVKYSNITLERSLTLEGTSLPENGQLFQLIEAELRNGVLIARFKAPSAQDYNSSRSNTTAIIDEGPDVTDLRVTVEKDGDGDLLVLDLTKQFYDSTTGVLLASFEHPTVPDESTIEVKVNYLEGRKIVVHEVAHVAQQRSPGTHEPGELQLLTEELLGDLLQTGTGSFSGGEFNDDQLDKIVGLSTNPLYEENSSSGTNPLFEESGKITGGTGEITLLDNVIAYAPENLFTIVIHDGEQADTTGKVESDYIQNNITVQLKNLDIEANGTVEIVHAYANVPHNWINSPSHGTAYTYDQLQSIGEELVVNLSKTMKPGLITSTSVFGLLTIHKEVIKFSKTELTQLKAVIVGTERTNPELDDEVLVAIISGSGETELRKYKVFDYGNSFRNDEDAYLSFARYLDEDSDGDGLEDVVFTKDHKPITVTKPIDKATPLLMAPDGGLGDNVTLYLENGKVIFWSDNIDQDCDGDDDTHRTITYIDTIELDLENQVLRTGRNPQTGKEIKIAAKTPIVIDHADGSVTVSTLAEPDNILKAESSFPYTRVIADTEGHALLIHIIQDAIVVYVETKELDKSNPKLLFTNTDDLTDEEIDFLLSNEHEIEKFVFRQEFGPVQGTSARFYNNGKFAEFIEYTTEAKAAAKRPRFKAGADLSSKVKSADTGGLDNDCNLVQVGDPPVMDSHVDLSLIDDETNALIIVDSFFDIFTEVSVDFRGHVTVLK